MGWIGVTPMLLWVADLVSKATGRPVRPLTRGKNEFVQRLIYGGNQQCAEVRDWLYKDATVWLPRKRQRLDSIEICSEWPGVSSRIDYERRSSRGPS